ncbi:MAG TPA: helix-turn-helix domain-containing protein [Candidatus Binatia bacterium]|nr:helix-turn-helix domain-containing protein [Candidatus Binatia bacterium]
MRHPNHRLAKVHRSYTVEEVARLLSVHKNTVREWIRRGLPTCDDRRPVLILGSDLRAFLTARRIGNKRPCKPGEIYCVRCREPRRPAEGMADYCSVTETRGNLVGICPSCGCVMYRCVNRLRLTEIKGDLDVAFPVGRRDIGKTPYHSANHDLEKERAVDANSQPQ